MIKKKAVMIVRKEKLNIGTLLFGFGIFIILYIFMVTLSSVFLPDTPIYILATTTLIAQIPYIIFSTFIFFEVAEEEIEERKPIEIEER